MTKLSLLLACVLASGPAFAAAKPAKPAPKLTAKAPAAKGNPKTVALNPAALRNLLVHENLPVLMGLNKLQQAKTQVNLSRAQLLPKLNIGAALDGIASGGASFMLSSVSSLLPFLLPSNWANLHESEYLLRAEKSSYYLVKLNQYASAYSLYTTILGDMALRDVLQQQYQDFYALWDWLVRQRDVIGTIPQSDINAAHAQLELAQANVAKMTEQLTKEVAALKEALAIPNTTTLTLDGTHVAASKAEAADLKALTAAFQRAAPENTQIAYLVKAAGEVHWARSFGFFSGAQLNVGGGDAGATSFQKLSLGTSWNLGFDLIPNVQLASENIDLLNLQARELRLQQGQLAEATLGSIAAAKAQVEHNATAERDLVGVYQNEFNKYSLGLSSLQLVIDAEKNITQASAARVQSMVDLDLLRITLHRALLTDQFASIPGCAVKASAEEADRPSLGKLFQDFSLSIDDVCQPAR